MTLSAFQESRRVCARVSVCERLGPRVPGIWKAQVITRQLAKNASSHISLTILILERPLWSSFKEEKGQGSWQECFPLSMEHSQEGVNPYHDMEHLQISKKSFPSTDLHCLMCLLSVIQHTVHLMDTTVNMLKGSILQYTGASLSSSKLPVFQLINLK